MQEIGSKEREAILKTIEPIIRNREVVATCAYGSQVAGYATAESDYDVIIVVKPFAQRVRYYYLKEETECAALAVDPRSFKNDCLKSSLGEFVSGRLLNPYQALSGAEYLKENEIAYKKRVILEALAEAYAEYLEFACEVSFPLNYFLFEKLRKRAAIYPPVVYSYAQTYGDELLESNLASSLAGFRSAASELSNAGMILFDTRTDSIRIPTQAFKGGLSARIEAAANYTRMSIAQYAVHGYAGRVRPVVVGKEVMSKISRSRKFSRLPDRISNPKKSWKISSGMLFISSSDWISDLVQSLGLDESSCRFKENSLGEFYNTASFYTLSDKDKILPIAVKRFQDFKGMKWNILNVWSLRNAKFTANPMERLSREYRAIREFRKFRLKTPEVLAVFLPQKILVTKFIAGQDLSRSETAYLEGATEDLSPLTRFGKSLAILHNNDYCMGDTKPSNVILSDSELYFTDLEQALPGGNRVWDVAEFIYYSVRFTLKEDRVRKMVNAFVSGYTSVAEDPSVVDRVLELRYRAPFQAFIAPNVLSALKNDLPH
jgi:tRNA A-37 threonylcarbamoyl transferase component Bud32/predicted nucleotidyltransferase